jgi:GT2 family glycosyltransferase
MKTSSSPFVSFIIVTYKRPDFLARTLKAIRRQDYRPLEVLIVDNGGDLTEAALDDIKSPDIEARIIDAGGNVGPGEGRNVGMAYATGEHVIFVDDDAEIHEPGAVRRLISILEQHPQCGCVTGLSRHPAGGINPFDVPMNVRRQAETIGTVETISLTTMLAAVRKSAVMEVGGFPPYMYCMEEYDLALKLMDAGYLIMYTSEASVIHHKTTIQGHTQRHDQIQMALQCSLNRLRTAFRLLPYPLPYTMVFTRLLRLLWLSRGDLRAAMFYLRTLIRERLTDDRQPISLATVGRLVLCGGWNMLI